MVYPNAAAFADSGVLVYDSPFNDRSAADPDIGDAPFLVLGLLLKRLVVVGARQITPSMLAPDSMSVRIPMIELTMEAFVMMLPSAARTAKSCRN